MFHFISSQCIQNRISEIEVDASGCLFIIITLSEILKCYKFEKETDHSAAGRRDRKTLGLFQMELLSFRLDLVLDACAY